MSLTNEELIQSFVLGYQQGGNRTGSLHIGKMFAKENNLLRTVLFSYATPIAVRGYAPCGDLFYLLVDRKFSTTTSIHQSKLKQMIANTTAQTIQLNPLAFKEYLDKQEITYDNYRF
ncbi:MAG: hypothetical protein QXL94_00225 [Candidatus Parvarchaeum sp.]